mmetsp:Transcript_62506/g.101094  ORF Transcript_62506/g.101094 Transcript_62506/m.101094 type:complete len:304 (-) Transcript_62506:708-1619(-)
MLREMGIQKRTLSFVGFSCSFLLLICFAGIIHHIVETQFRVLSISNLESKLPSTWNKYNQTEKIASTSSNLTTKVGILRDVSNKKWRPISKINYSALNEQNQVSHATQFNRYPLFYSLAHDLWNSRENVLPRNMTILSFGSSSGMEALALATIYFKTNKILGLDVDETVLDQARTYTKLVSNRVVFYNSKKFVLEQQFGIIFANSVLCCHDVSCVAQSNVPQAYPFAKFSSTLEQLDKMLAPGGYLFVYNPSYQLRDTILTRCYQDHGIVNGGCGFVPVHNRHGSIVANNACAFRKSLDCSES